MAHYGCLATYQFPDRAEDIRGATVYGLNDEKLGKIDDVIFNHSSGNVTYLVVDTGGWLSTKKFLVSADRIRASRSRHFRLTTRKTWIRKRDGLIMKVNTARNGKPVQ